MKKLLLTTLLLVFLVSGVQLMYGQQKRIYNDGVIDYVPLTASFVLSAEDYESTLQEIQFSMDAQAPEIYSGPISFDTEGRHFIAYRAVDKTGNITNEKIYSVVVDGSPPDGLASVDGPVFLRDEDVYMTTESTIVLWAEDTYSGVDAIYVKLDNGPYISYSEPVRVTEEGFHTAETYAVDNVGNVTPTFLVQGWVDSTPPMVQIVPENPFVVVSNRNYTDKNNEFTIRAYDEIAGVERIDVSLDGSDYFTFTDAFKVQIPGNHTLSAKAVDNLGNESSVASINFFVDVVPPESTLDTSVD
jgi:hypothetical protein